MAGDDVAEASPIRFALPVEETLDALSDSRGIESALAAQSATSMVLDAIEQAISTRQQERVRDFKDVVHQSDRGSPHLDPVHRTPHQDNPVRCTTRLRLGFR
ncbi:hypothetical protein MPRM_45040 [Mycobacterium parmense]|uniref:Uncharacterized protein n=1 Tax=Mycobacterium parmense TaxID=185642 RepID=A0A7I7Z232_9MYCO|nr:hypothetical protein MPRM_45040 [Mycobacterium parmense]